MSLALQRGVLHRHAMMEDPGVSEMSLGLQLSERVSGSVMGPRRIEGEKHSRITDVSVGDFCQEYLEQRTITAWFIFERFFGCF